jgi:site-specific recombinase XerD
MNPETSLVISAEHLSLDQLVRAWLHEKQGHSESRKTRQSYEETLRSFRAALQAVRLDLDSDPAQVALVAQGWAALSTNWAKPRTITPATYNHRLAVVSSFYRYCQRHEQLPSNPIERVARRVVRSKDAARPLSREQVQAGLAKVDRSTPEGQRDYALLVVALATGRRVSEIAGLHLRDLQFVSGCCHVYWARTKGNKQMQDLLRERATAALYVYLQTIYGPDFADGDRNRPVWVSFSNQNAGQAVGIKTLSRICETYLGSSKFHTTRHTWTVTMHKQGASLAEIGKGLGHSNLKTTADYLEELLGYENPYASGLEEAFGF